MSKREIHIWDLPTNKIYIKLKDNFREQLFKKAYKKEKNWNKLGKKIKVKRPDTLLARDWKRGSCSFPLETAIKLCKIANISTLDLESNLEEIRYKKRLNKRGGNSGKPLKKPKFPIKVDRDFIEIIGHICGDGSIPKSKKRTAIPLCYINSQPELLENFKMLINKVFGEIEPAVSIRDDPAHYTRPNYYLRYPTLLSTIVLIVFKGKQYPLEFPSYLLKTKEKQKVFLKAIYDDEGYIPKKDKKIIVGMKSKQFIEGCKNILKEIGIKTGSIHKKEEFYIIEVAEGDSIKKFSEEVKIIHPMKIDRLNKIIKRGWKFKRNKKKILKKIIINLIETKPKSVKELSKIMNKQPQTIRQHLNNLKEEGKLICVSNFLRTKEGTNINYKLWSKNK